VTSNAISCDIKKRLRLMLTLKDPNIIFDLQINNRFNKTKFDTFWNELEAYFNKQVYAYFIIIYFYWQIINL